MTIAPKIFTAAITLCLISTSALAQVRQVQMGGGMDANPGVGAGGSNKPVPGFVPVNQNNIMTGNVTGLSYFHGRVGSSDPYQFQGNLGSSALNNFARQSAGSNNYAPYTGAPQPYYLPSSTVSTGAGSLYSAPVGSGFDSSLVPQNSYSPAATPTQLSRVNGEVTGQAINRAVQAAPIEAGEQGAVLSNPLFILRTTELPRQRKPIEGQPATPLSPTDANKPPDSLHNNSTGETKEPTTKPANPQQVEAGINGGLDARVVSQNPEIKDAMVSETYQKLADELHKAKGTAPGAAGSTDIASATPAKTGMNNSGIQLDPLTGKPRLIATLPPIPGSRGAGGATGLTNNAGTTAPQAPSAGSLTKLSDAELQVGGKVKPVRLAPLDAGGSQVSAFDIMMSRAGRNLKEGQFMDAAQSYQAALALKPDDPLALVGRAHAEMAAGIYSPSERDLKFVFTRKPEMLAVKYDVDSFIPAAARQAFLLEDLKKLTANKDSAPMASFLYCYLCYQTGRTAQLNDELKTWSERDKNDEWEIVAQRAWTSK